MRKKNLLIASLMAAVLAGCSTSDGLYVGDVSNTACTRTRSGDVAGVIDNPTLKLTKEGSTITGVLKSFEVNCDIEKDVIVKCHQEGSNLLIEAHEELGWYCHQLHLPCKRLLHTLRHRGRPFPGETKQ